jgi:hypothetical protein
MKERDGVRCRWWGCRRLKSWGGASTEVASAEHLSTKDGRRKGKQAPGIDATEQLGCASRKGLLKVDVKPDGLGCRTRAVKYRKMELGLVVTTQIACNR